MLGDDPATMVTYNTEEVMRGIGLRVLQFRPIPNVFLLRKDMGVW